MGLIVGYAQEGGTFRAFTAGTGPLTALPLPDGYTSQWATAVNAAGQNCRLCAVQPRRLTNGFLNSFGQNHGPGASRRASHVIVTALNGEGVVFGHALYPNGAASRAVRWDSGQWVEIGDVLGGGRTEVTGANRYGQVVGRALTTNGVWHAFLYTDGRAFDLNALQPSGSIWTLSSAADNDRAQIAPRAPNPTAHPRPSLLFPATEIGRRVFRPEGTHLAILLDHRSPGWRQRPETGNSFFWSAVDQKLFAIRPVVAEINGAPGPTSW